MDDMGRANGAAAIARSSVQDEGIRGEPSASEERACPGSERKKSSLERCSSHGVDISGCTEEYAIAVQFTVS